MWNWECNSAKQEKYKKPTSPWSQESWSRVHLEGVHLRETKKVHKLQEETEKCFWRIKIFFEKNFHKAEAFVVKNKTKNKKGSEMVGFHSVKTKACLMESEYLRSKFQNQKFEHSTWIRGLN